MTSTRETLSRVLQEEAEAIRHLAEHLPESFTDAVAWIVGCDGRIITCGIGKSGHIARKTAGTLSSTGTPSSFMHAAEALHGDLGMVTASDIVLAYTHSGETQEILALFQSLRVIGARTILITGRPESSAAQLSDLVLDTGVISEACSINLAPTTSTTVMLAVSDALAVAAMESRGFRREDFAVFHPSGSLGRRLLLRVQDVMRSGPDNAVVSEGSTVEEVTKAITNAGAGAACVIGVGGEMVGIITDGDIRRCWQRAADKHEFDGIKASEIMSSGFTSTTGEILAAEALEVFQNHPKKLGEMPVLDADRKPVGMLVLKDLMRSGIV